MTDDSIMAIVDPTVCSTIS